jgi:hypothetical protein
MVDAEERIWDSREDIGTGTSKVDLQPGALGSAADASCSMPTPPAKSVYNLLLRHSAAILIVRTDSCSIS